MPCRVEQEGVIPGLSLSLKQGSALQKVPGEEACPDSAHHGGATKTTPLMSCLTKPFHCNRVGDVLVPLAERTEEMFLIA